MINNLEDLVTTLNERWLEQAQPDPAKMPVRVYLNGNYIIEKVEADEDGIFLWLDERGDPDEA